MGGIQSLGIGSGLDLNSLVSRLLAAERQPVEVRLARSEARYQSQLSALGTLKGAMSSLQTQAAKLADGSVLAAGREASSSNEELFTATATSDAARATFSVRVDALAQAAKLSSGAFANADTAVGTGTLTIAVGDQSMDLTLVDGENSLADIRDAINSATDNSGVSASIVNDSNGASLVFTGNETGEANAITITASGGDGGLNALRFDPTADPALSPGLTQIEAAQNAEILIDGQFSVSSTTNEVEGAIDGVTLNLVSADPATTETLTVTENRKATIDAVSKFVDRLNGLRDAIDQVTAFNAETGQAAALLGDSTVRGIETQIRRITGDIVSGAGAFNSLPALGITTNDDGRLELDKETLNDVIDQQPAALEAALGGENGIATRLDGFLGAALGEDGRISVRQDGLQTSIDRLDDERERLDRRLESLESRFVSQFTALDSLVSELNQTSTFLSQQLSNISNIYSSRR